MDFDQKNDQGIAEQLLSTWGKSTLRLTDFSLSISNNHTGSRTSLISVFHFHSPSSRSHCSRVSSANSSPGRLDGEFYKVCRCLKKKKKLGLQVKRLVATRIYFCPARENCDAFLVLTHTFLTLCPRQSIFRLSSFTSMRVLFKRGKSETRAARTGHGLRVDQW